MSEPGQRLRRHRELLQLKYRDVAEGSRVIAERHKDPAFLIGLSRLSDIENKGTLPTIYRLYSLSAIYGLQLESVLAWYGVDTGALSADTVAIARKHTGLVEGGMFERTELGAPAHTRLVSGESGWSASLAVAFFEPGKGEHYRHAFIGLDDMTMYPYLQPGSLVQVDTRKRKVSEDGWRHELERPLYLVEHRAGFLCGWCADNSTVLTVISHPASGVPSRNFQLPHEAEVVGQVVAIAMHFRMDRRHHRRS